MANNSPTIVAASLSDDQLKKSIDSLVTHVDEAMKKMVQSTNKAVGEMEAKLKSLGNLKIDSGGSADGGASKRAKAQNAETAAIEKSNQAAKEKIMTLDQQASAINTVVQSEKKYTDEIIRQAKAVRENKAFKEEGFVRIGNDVFYNNAFKQWKNVASVEEQILQVNREREIAQQRIVLQEQREKQEKIEAAQAALQQLGIERQITQEQEKRRRYKAPETYTGFDVSRDKLSGLIARRNGILPSQVVNWDEQTSSIKTLSAALKQYQEAYTRMSATERNSPFGKQMISDMHVLERELQKLRGDMSRMSKEQVFNLPTKTLDDMAYKLRQLASYRSGLNVKTQVNEISQVNAKYAELQKRMNEVMQKNNQMIASNTALGRSWNYMKNRLAFYFTVSAGTSFIKQLIDIRGQYELLERSISILIDSAQNGRQVFAELNAMAIKSPYTTMELGAAAKQLVAYDIAAKDVVDTTRRLADMAAAVGIPIERLTYALGQIKAYGYLNARDARMFANAGIPLVKELADRYTELEGRLVSTADIYDRIKKKAIDYSDVMDVVNKMTDEGGKFFNFQEKAADTLKVKIANLTLAFNNMLNEMGKDQQGLLTSGLATLKEIFEHWRDIVNMANSFVLTLGLAKTTQLLYLTLTSAVVDRTRALIILQEVLGKKIAAHVGSYAKLLGSFATNPFALATTGVVVLSTYLGKLLYDYNDLIEANEKFNKSIVDNANENIKSIDKFFDEYENKFNEIGSLNKSDQIKLWERLQEEIEKTTKNAEDYINILEQIQDIATRISMGQEVLENSKKIQEELKRLAESGTFNLGGGYGDNEAAKDLQNYDKTIQKLVATYGSLAEAEKKLGNLTYGNTWKNYRYIEGEVNNELDNLITKLDKVNIAEILGSGNVQSQLANIREFAIAWRDAFLATEEGAKIGTQGQALLNNKLDEWIAKVGRENALYEDRIINEKKYNAETVSNIESRRTAWEEFFRYFTREERKAIDVAIKTNNTGGEEVKKIWSDAAKRMAEKSETSFKLIQDQIANLRNTPAIVIDVIYRQKKDNFDAQQKSFRDKYITPDNLGVLSLDKYLKQEAANTQKYARFMKKTGEDNVEWEKRLGQEYQNNKKNIKSLTDQIAKSANMSEIDRKAKQEELDTLKAQQVVLKDIEKDQGFNYNQFGKGGKDGSKKDVLGDALTKEVQLIGEIQKRYKEYQQIGVNAQDAIRLATEEYGNTLKRTNATLAKYGISTKTSEELAGMDIRDVRDYYKSLLEMAKSTGNAKGIEAIEKALANINVEITKLDYKKITDGLNNELGKLKDEYELAVELDANPELGDMFTNMFGLDTSGLPKSIDEYMYRAQQEFDKKRAELHYDTPLDIFRASSEDWERWGKEVGLSEEALKSFNGKFVEAQGVAKKWAQDIVTNTKKLEYELADLDKKIAIKEQEQLDLQKQIDEESNEEQRHYLMLLYQNNEKVINELRAQALSLMPEYARVFNSIAEHSAGVARRLQQDLMRVFDTAKFDSSTNKWTLTSSNGKQTILDDKTYRKEREKLTREMRKSQSPFQKIKEAFKPSDKNGVVDYAKGIELLSGEIQKLGNVASEVGNLAQIFGADEQTVEIINDVAASLNGVATAGQGIAQIASRDYIGGAASVLSGVVSVIGAWADNSDKQISAEIKESELAVKRLELAYIDLEQAVNRAYGASVAGAKRATLANKELQLEEIKRQIQLEKSRDSKHRDEGRIIELQKQYKELMYEIQNGTREIVDDLLGTDAGSFAEDLVQSMIDAFRRGEDYMEVFEKKFETMVDNMIMKVIVSRVVSSYIDRIWDSLDKRLTARSEKEAKDLAEIQNKRAQIEDMSDEQVARIAGHTTFGWDSQTIHQWAEEYRNMLNEEEKAAQAAFDAATEIDNNDINFLLSEIARISPELAEKLKEAIGEWYHFGEDSQLSQLQQGIQGITENTAGALEAYMNGVSQQVYYQSDVLTQIRDTVQSFDIDVQTGTLSQILLQLQASFQTQNAIRSILEGWSSASGMSMRVELVQ